MGAERRHPTLVCSRTQKLQQHTGVDTGLLRSTFGRNWMTTDILYGGTSITPGFLCCYRTIFGSFPPTPLLNIGEVASLQESLSLFNEVGDSMLYASTLSWLFRSRIRSLQLRTSKCFQWMLSHCLRQIAFYIRGNPGLCSPGQHLTSIALQ